MLKPSLSLWTIQKQVTGGIWPADPSQQSWSRLMPYHCSANTLHPPHSPQDSEHVVIFSSICDLREVICYLSILS